MQASYTHLTRFFSRNHEAESGNARDELLLKAKAIMNPFILRRRKDQVLQDLPKKTSEVQFCTLDGKQLAEYKKTILEFKTAAADAKAGGSCERLPGTKNVMMQLRKLCLHPMLLRVHYTDTVLHEMTTAIMKEDQYRDNNATYIYEDMTVMSDFELNHLCSEFPRSLTRFAMASDAIQESIKIKQLRLVLKERQSKGDRVLLFSQVCNGVCVRGRVAKAK